MTLLIFLVAYVVRRKLDSRGQLDLDVFWRWLFQKSGRAPAGKEDRVWSGLALITVVPVLLLLVESGLREYGWRPLGYPIEFIVLILVLGVPAWKQVLETYTQAWQQGDMQGAWHHVKEYLPAESRGTAGAPEAVHLALSGRFMVTVFERYFLMVFWYAVGGMAAALFVSGVIALRDHWPQLAARKRFARLAAILSWVPARLLAISFGVAGDLAGWLKQRRNHLLSPNTCAEDLLLRGADSALTGYALSPTQFATLHPDEWLDFGGRSLEALRDLLNRSMLVWVCGLALLVIAGLV